MSQHMGIVAVVSDKRHMIDIQWLLLFHQRCLRMKWRPCGRPHDPLGAAVSKLAGRHRAVSEQLQRERTF